MEKSLRQETLSGILFSGTGWVEHRRGEHVYSIVLRRLAMTGLLVEASRKVHATVGVVSLPDVGVCHDR